MPSAQGVERALIDEMFLTFLLGAYEYTLQYQLRDLFLFFYLSRPYRDRRHNNLALLSTVAFIPSHSCNYAQIFKATVCQKRVVRAQYVINTDRI